MCIDKKTSVSLYADEFFYIDVSKPDIINNINQSHDLVKAFYLYEKALIDNNVDMLDNFFLNHAASVRFGAEENLYGYDAIQEYRRSRNPGSAVRQITRNRFVVIGNGYGVVNTEFIRHANLGRQTQVWFLSEDGWRIVSAHISSID